MLLPVQAAQLSYLAPLIYLLLFPPFRLPPYSRMCFACSQGRNLGRTEGDGDHAISDIWKVVSNTRERTKQNRGTVEADERHAMLQMRGYAIHLGLGANVSANENNVS